VGLIVLSWFQAQGLLKARAASRHRTTASLDLNLTTTIVDLDEQGVTLPDGQSLSWDAVEEIANDRKHCFLVVAGALRKIQAFSETTRLMRTLFPTRDAPTMMVSGFPMHRIRGTTPMEDTRTKLDALGRLAGCRVLDTATGLGYTAIEATRRGAKVLTIELDPIALEIARQNPWSQPLFENDRIESVIGDVREVVRSLPRRSFQVIVHDPPSIQLAGELYSLELYAEFHCLLTDRGRLFHYTGDPKSALGDRTTRGVMRRLHEAGFDSVRRAPEAFGVIAEKRPPRRVRRARRTPSTK
jgi:predicted methyltransferase